MTQRDADRPAAGGALRRRLIGDDDLPTVAAALARAFPRRGEAAFAAALDRLRRREPPPGLPRFGTLLEAGSRIVGALLTICTAPEPGGTARCHLSSWFVDPAHAAGAPLLLGPLLRRRDVTLINLSPARHTEAIIAAQGFRPFCHGSQLVLPLLLPAASRARILDVGAAAALPEAVLLQDHLRWGCRCLGIAAGGDTLPFVFAPPRRLRGVLPVSHLLYCRDLDGFAANAGALGRRLLRHGILGVTVDAPAAIPGLPGRRVGGTQGRYWRGPSPPRPGDLGYSEHALFAPSPARVRA